MAPRIPRLLAAAAATGLVLTGTSACSSGSSDASSTASEKGKITWLSSPLGPAGTDARRALVAAFEKAHPGISVKLVNSPTSTDTTRSTLTTQISGGASTPDVYNGDVVWPAQFGKAGLALPLTGRLPAGFWNRFTPGLTKSMTYQGKVMAAPFFTDQAFLYYRKDLLAKAHLPVPTTWEQVQKTAAKLQAKHLVKYGYVGQGASYEGLTCDWTELMTDAGGRALDASQKHAAIDSPQSLRALTYLRGLITSGVAPKAMTSFQEPQAEQLFTGGQAAFMRNWAYAYADANSKDSQVSDKVGVTTLPAFADRPGSGRSTIGGWNLYINPHSQHVGADLTFIKWMTDTQAQRILATKAGMLPTNAKVLKDQGVQSANPVLSVAARNKLAARPSGVPNYPQVSQAIYANINAALAGSASPKAALKTAASQINGALSQGGGL
ncbi:ABC transporter substrate-binding protein [Streptomyces sioyaensis]|uniref:ABC transporter substrate-binding protein n=1 Tax=Streptomyces sioyaensis TaxID=67364 RepID=UPI0037A334C3